MVLVCAHFGSTGQVAVDGAGSTWTNRGNVAVGSAGAGTLAITSGGIVSSRSGVIGHRIGSTGQVTVDGAGSTWINSKNVYVGHQGAGTLAITSGGAVSSVLGLIGRSSDFNGRRSGSTGQVTVDGVGSTWTNRGDLFVGFGGTGTLKIAGGGAVRSGNTGYVGYEPGSTGRVTVSGAGSTWTNSSELYVGYEGAGTLNITAGGVVSVEGTLAIDPYTNGNSFINMATGGELALAGNAVSSILEFLDLVEEGDAIRYWDVTLPGWAPITAATENVDYTLEYLTSGDLAGYTKLTVFTPIPEPTTWILWVLFLVAMMCQHRMVRA
jgi:T5SS/PEP-CTERM-associated repeat protein